MNNKITIDGNNNITIQDINNSTITINANDPEILEKIEELNKEQITVLLQMVNDQADRFSKLFKTLLDEVATQKNVVHGDITANNINIGDKTVHGDEIHYHYYYIKPEPLPKLLTPLPPLTEFFIGRTDELEKLHQKLFKGDNLIMLVNGEGGIGKTTFAGRYCHQYQKDYKHIAWVLSQKSIANALLTLEKPLGLSFPENMHEKDRLQELYKTMANLEKPCLLVIDNANEMEDLQQNYRDLRRCTNFHLLITSRITNFENINRFPIDSLPFDKALELFSSYYPQHQPENNNLLKKIHQAVGGNTLVIELLAKNLKQLNRKKTNYTLPQLLTDIQQKGLVSLTQSTNVSVDHWTHAQLKHQTPENIIKALYDITDLTENEKNLLAHITLLPAETIAYKTLEKLLGTLPAFEKTFDCLDQKGWINYNETERSLKFSPVVQQISATLNPQTADDVELLIDNLNYQLENDGGFSLINNTIDTASIYAHLAENIVQTLSKVNDTLSILTERTGTYYKAAGNFNKAIKFFELLKEQLKELCETNPQDEHFKNNLAIAYSKLGDIYQALGQFDKALKFFELDIELTKELYQANPKSENLKNGLAISYQRMGRIHQEMGNIDLSTENFGLYKSLMEELYKKNPKSEKIKNDLAIAYNNLAENYQALGEFDKALKFFELEHKLKQELYQANTKSEKLKNGLAIAYSKLGDIYKALGQFDKALKFFEQYNQLQEELYQANPKSENIKNGLAISYSKLGDIYKALGEFDKALKFFELEHKLKQELYQANPKSEKLKNGLAISYSKLGEIYQALGEFDKALKFFELETDLFKELYQTNPKSIQLLEGLAISYYKLAMLHKEMKDDIKGKAHFVEVKRIVEFLAENFPQIPKYQEMNKAEY